MITELEKKIDILQINDDEVESFRDVITDAVVENNASKLVPAGETVWFRGNAASLYPANNCELKVISHENISKDVELSERIHNLLKIYMIDPININLLHSKFLLNMQAERNIKIDIIWNVQKTDDEEFPNEFQIISFYFEDNGTGIDDEGVPNFDPRNNQYWDEFLVEFGIIKDPHSDE